MCQVDWTALGTWAAVVAALGIAVADKIAHWARLASERTALSAFIHADLVDVLYQLSKVSEEVALQEADHVKMLADSMLHKNADHRTELSDRALRLEVPAVMEASNRLHIFDAKTSKILADSITAVRTVRRGCEALSNPTPDDERFTAFMDAFREAIADCIRLTTAALVEMNRYKGTK